MTTQDEDRRYLVQQRKANPLDADKPIYARAMRGKEGRFEGVSFIRNKEKASVMTIEEAEEAIAWAKTKKSRAGEYVTSIICVGQ